MAPQKVWLPCTVLYMEMHLIGKRNVSFVEEEVLGLSSQGGKLAMPAVIGIISKLAGAWQLLPACAVPSPAFPTSQVLPEASQLSLPRWVSAPSPLYLPKVSTMPG